MVGTQSQATESICNIGSSKCISLSKLLNSCDPQLSVQLNGKNNNYAVGFLMEIK